MTGEGEVETAGETVEEDAGGSGMQVGFSREVRGWVSGVRGSHFRLWDVMIAFSMLWGAVWGGVYLWWLQVWWEGDASRVAREGMGSSEEWDGGWFPVVVRILVLAVGVVGWWMFSKRKLETDSEGPGIWGGSRWERYMLVWCCAGVGYGMFLMVVGLAEMNGFLGVAAGSGG